MKTANIYTKEEVRILIDMLEDEVLEFVGDTVTNANLLRDLINYIVDLVNILKAITTSNSNMTHDCFISELIRKYQHLEEYHFKLAHILFYERLNRMPALINEEACSVISRFRLGLGK